MGKKNFSLTKSVLKIDQFGKDVKFNIEGKDETRTYVGVFFTLLTLFVIIHYATIKIIILENYDDSIYSSITQPIAINEVQIADTNFNVAFGMVDYINQFQEHEVDYYGYIEFQVYMANWTFGEEDG